MTCTGGPTKTDGARLADFGTFKLGGPCLSLLDCRGSSALVEAVAATRAERVPYVLIGGGSNLLISDQGYPGVVIRYAEGPGPERSGNLVEVSGATTLDRAAAWAAEAGLDGLTYCTGIPGTVGGAIVGNAGAWGRQIAESLVDVTVLTPAGAQETLRAENIEFAYRKSQFQRDGGIVLSARLALTPADSSALLAERRRILEVRAGKHPDLATTPCIGSIFRNIEPTSAAGRRQAAGWFLEQAGAGDLTEGGAEVYEKHANIIVARPGCTAQNVRDLAHRMAIAVREKFGLELVREVRYLGTFDGESHHPGFF